MPDGFAELIRDSFMSGFITGILIFLQAAWPYILFLIALSVLYGTIRKKHKRRHT